MIEEWKIYKETYNKYTHKGGKYEVSNKGNVRCNGKDYKPTLQHTGYYKVGGFGLLHRIVAELFIPNPENKPCIDHIDGDKSNNKAENLRWVTSKENNNNPITIQRLIISRRKRNFKPSINFIKSTLGKHRVYDNKELKIYHYE